MAIYFQQLVNQLNEYNLDERDIGRFYSRAVKYFETLKRRLEGEETISRFCFEIKDGGEEKVRDFLTEKKIPFELNPLGESSSLLKIFN